MNLDITGQPPVDHWCNSIEHDPYYVMSLRLADDLLEDPNVYVVLIPIVEKHLRETVRLMR